MSKRKSFSSTHPDDEVEETPPEEVTTVEDAYGQYLQLSREVVLPGQDSHDDFILLRDHLFCDAQPADAIEGMLVDRLVSLIWRLRRTHRIEREIFDRITEQVESVDVEPSEKKKSGTSAEVINELIDSPSLVSLRWLSQYESQLDRSLYRALVQLRTQQFYRTQREQSADKQVQDETEEAEEE